MTASSVSQISGTTFGQLQVVEGMHSRKARMFEEADAFIAIPGGLGTLDETIEISTWQQLGLHCKPIGLLNINGYFDKFIEFLDHAEEEVCLLLIINISSWILRYVSFWFFGTGIHSASQ